MRKTPILILVTVLLAGVGLTLTAAPERARPTIDRAELSAKAAALRELPREERRAQLKAMAPEERRGLWFALKREQFTARGGEVADYEELEGFPVEAKPASPARTVPTKNALGTIVYDSGFPTIAFGGGAIIGNRFDTHTGIPVCNPGTVSTVQALVVPGPANTTSSVGLVITGPQTGGGGAMGLFSTFGVASGLIDSVTFAGLGVTYTGSSFFVLLADFASVYIPAYGTGTTMGQGHHGMVGYTGGMFPDITGTFDFGGALNAFIRATGVIVPVELTTFSVD